MEGLGLQRMLGPIYDRLDRSAGMRRFAARWIYKKPVHVDYFARAVLLLASWAALDTRFAVIGWKSQLVALAFFQAFLLVRIALRLGLLASQLELHRARAGGGARAGKGGRDRV